MDGLEYLNKIELGPYLPYSVIVLTAHDDSESVKACYDAGVNLLLRKPFDTQEIRGAVKNAIDVRQAINHLDELTTLQNFVQQKHVRDLATLKQLLQQFHQESDAIIGAYAASNGL